MYFKVGDKVLVINCSSILTPKEFLHKEGTIIGKGNAFDWRVEFKTGESCVFNEVELELLNEYFDE